MPWLAKLDARAAKTPIPFRMSYLGLRWFLIVMGVYLMLMSAVTELSQGRLGIGIGVVTAVCFALIKGVSMAITGSRPER